MDHDAPENKADLCSAANLLWLGERPPIASSSALEVLQQAFSRPRAPRSEAYQQGLLVCLRVRLERDPLGHCPYAEGSAERDAFFAGVEEARVLVGPWNVAKKFSGPAIMTM